MMLLEYISSSREEIGRQKQSNGYITHTQKHT